MKQRITLTLEADLVEAIDEKRGDIPRSRFIERLLVTRNSETKEVEVDGYA